MKSDVDVIVKVNAVQVPKDFYQSGDQWHFTLGDGATGSLTSEVTEK